MKRIELIGHRGNILSLSWNLTGSHLASGSSDGTIRLWSKDRIDDAFSNVPSPRDINTSTQNPRALTLPTVKSSTEIRPLKSVSKSIDQICWSPCEANVFAFISSTDRSLCVWDSQRIDAEYSGSYVFIGEESSSAHHCLSLCWSPDGAFLCVATKNSTIYFVSVMREDSPFNISLRVVHATKFKEPINQVKWISLDTIYVTTTVGTVEILKREDESAPLMTLMTSSLEDCEEIVRKELDFKPWKLCRGHSASCYTVAMDKEMRRFATGGGDATVALWDVKTLSCYCSVIHYKLVAGAGEDLFVDVLDPHTGSSVYKIPTRGPSNCLTFNPKKALLCFACDEVSHPSNASRKSIHVIDLSTEDAPAR